MKSLEDKTDISEDKEIEEKVKSTKSLIQTFLQTLKAFRLYEANHPILSKFLDRLRKDFEHYFGEFDSFSLQIGEHRLFYRGNIVYESEDVKESLAFLFFKDGIREIQFSKGLEYKEMIDFLNVVRKGDLLNRMEDDLVTLLWEKDFSHITFTAVDEFMEGGATLVPATEEDLIKGSEYKGSLEEEKVDEGRAESQSPSLPVQEGLERAINPAPGQSLVQACQLTPEEREAIDREARQEEQPDYIFILINNLIEILLHLGEDADAYENMISYFDRVIEYLLEQKDVGKAVALMSSLNETMDSIMMKDKQIFAIQRILENSSSPRLIELLGKAMKGNGEAQSESILEYLRLLTKQAVEPLCLLLGEVESGKWRKTICERLTALCRGGIQPLSKFLSNENPMLVCHVLYILGTIGDPSTMDYLGELVTHRDLKVREETLQILNKFGEKGKDLMRGFLTDSISGIRSKAALLLARSAKGEAVKPLTDIILSEDFYKRDYKEKASFFRALGETGAKEVVPILEGISKRRHLFQREKWSEMRQCAANTLKMLGA
ncbi:MAG TPA: HEAT repeat domain-containing protein [Thermodesulfobacteriota bacterium]|nr:HEAT repeat domain-containing protein [Thermodesulfobacteriota bacterium]